MSGLLPSREMFRLLIVGGLAVAMWFLSQGLDVRWSEPPAYNIDALETLTRFKLAQEQGATLLVDPAAPRLGSPWGADWSAYPLPDALWYWFIGRLAGMFGLMPAAHAALLLAHVLATLAFYATARTLRHGVPFAIGAALLFGFCYSIFQRGFAHHSFALIFSVPPAILLAWVIGGSRRLLEHRRWQGLCVGIGVLIGLGNPYFIFMALQLAGLACAYQLFTSRRWANVRIALVSIATILLVFVLTNLPAIGAMLGEGRGAFARNYAATEIYGLRLVDLFVPHPHHRWESAAEFGRLYAASTHLRGELFTPYAGLMGGIALLLMAGDALRRGLAQRSMLRPSHASYAAWIYAFAMTGGLNGLLALAGFDLFRAGNRYSVHLLALALLFFSGWATRRARRWPVGVRWLAAGVTVAVGLWDQLPSQPSHVHHAEMRRLAEQDRGAVAQLEAQLPAGAQLFQMPVVHFPEAGPREKMADYEHARLFVHSRHLRFSYGAMRHTGEFRWADWVAHQPAATLIDQLQNAGFDGVLIDRRGYPNDAETLLAALAQAGAPHSRVEAAPHLAFVRLHPAANPQRPDANAMRWQETWAGGRAASETLSLHALSGWYPPERGPAGLWRWAGNSAEIGVWNGSAERKTVVLAARIGAARRGELRVRSGEHVVWRGEVGGPTVPLEIKLTLEPGSTRLRWDFFGRTILPASDPRRLGFMVENLELRGP